MTSYKLNGWGVALAALNGSFVVATSEGTLQGVAEKGLESSFSAHAGTIRAIDKISEHLLASVAEDGLRIWDLRTQRAAHHVSGKFLSVAHRDTAIAAGTELEGQDAKVNVYDLRTLKSVRAFVDSHHDDVTALQFHSAGQFLMLGLTDGYVNVYNLNEPDEDEALHQVINYASVHQCRFTLPQRIGVLSHMETMAFYELNSMDYETNEEPKPRDLGDVRRLWNCEYVVDFKSGYVVYGSSSLSALSFRPFNALLEKFGEPVHLESVHNGEVVRDFEVAGHAAVTCGEDSRVAFWTLPKAEWGGKRARGKKFAPY